MNVFIMCDAYSQAIYARRKMQLRWLGELFFRKAIDTNLETTICEFQIKLI